MYKDLTIAPHVSASIFIYSIVVLTVAIITAEIAKNKLDRIQIIWTYYSSKTTTTISSFINIRAIMLSLSNVDNVEYTNRRKFMMRGVSAIK